MLDDIATTIKAQLYERVTSPLLGAFLISWCIINYKLILIVLSSLSAPEKIVYIELNLFCTTSDYIFKGVIYPLAAALSLILIYPYPAAWIYRVSKTHKRHLKQIQQTIDDETPLTKDDARKIRKDALEIEIKADAELARKKNEIDNLRQTNLQLQGQLELSAKRSDEQTSTFAELEGRVLESSKTIMELRSRNEELEVFLYKVSNNPKIHRGEYLAKNIDTESLSLQHTSSSNQPSEIQKQEAAEFYMNKITNYIQDIGLFKNKKAITQIISNNMITNYTEADGRSYVYNWGKIDVLNPHKSINQMMDYIRSHPKPEISDPDEKSEQP
ncbi:hypothetical protein [Pseudomonas sp. 'CRE Jenny 4']|uniref:hypothetical protein n=1 Tax=Pseudomonas sp. 'CRE Jenny 4' TaxID=3045817 RepID=UPI00259FE1B4|nr:hypothetical protein [Pseudomonas sp. 'CRE Jenny 4']